MHWLPAFSIRGSLYVLPNGDVLVVESNGPKAPISSAQGHHHRLGAVVCRRQGKGRQPYHAAARTPMVTAFPSYEPRFWTISTRRSASPWFGHDLYVANTDAIVRYPYQDGQTSNHGPKAPSSPIFPADRSIITGPRLCWPVRTAPKLYVGVGSNSNIGRKTENRGRIRARPAIWEGRPGVGRAIASFASGEFAIPPGLQWEPETGKTLGDRQRTR